MKAWSMDIPPKTDGSWRGAWTWIGLVCVMCFLGAFFAHFGWWLASRYIP